MKRTLLSTFLMCSFFLGLQLDAQINFNGDWQFLRLDEQTSNDSEIINQGKDWSSQYNISHVSQSDELEVSEGELKKEFTVLAHSEWESVNLPHTAKVEDLVVHRQWQGICYYKKEFFADNDWKDKSCYIEFEGAMQLADVWINGKHILQHAGGYTPFVIDISCALLFDRKNEILVRLDNNNNPLIPPGKPIEKLDFCYYGGIYRDVNLIIKDKMQISHTILEEQVAGGGIFVRFPEVSIERSMLDIQTHLINKGNSGKRYILRQELFELEGLFSDLKRGKLVAVHQVNVDMEQGEDQHFSQMLEVDNPKLWFPDTPHLYVLSTQILRGRKVIDTEETRIGIRHIEFSNDKGFVINGKQVRLVGCNRHMEYPYVGNALPENAQYRDIYHIKESGFNTVRLGHYPQDISVLDACDELGLLVIEPIPGWQFYNRSKQFNDLTYRDVKHMIRRDRNHPSIIMWETILNESNPPKDWKDKVVELAHAEYPGDQCYTSGDTYGYFGYDVQYNDWKRGFQRPNTSDKAGFIREYYDYEFGGHYSTTRIGRGEGEDALLQNAWNAQWSHNRYRADYPQTTGDAVWSMYDYNRGCCDNICRSGVADLFRLEKWSIPFFRSQIPIGTPLPSGKMQPYVFIAENWEAKDGDNKVIVYSNCEEVALLVNGGEVARQKKDIGPDSEYGPEDSWSAGGVPFDGGNCRNLNYAPFTFRNVEWEEGELKAFAYEKGDALARHIVCTPGQVAELEIDYFRSGKEVEKNDLIIVYVKVKDQNSSLCVFSEADVNLKVTGGGKIVGPEKIAAEAGIASFLVATIDAEELHLVAESSGMSTDFRLGLK